ncbi:MAG: hypothetical protein JXR64_03410 [Spirochaetales bacterium]|nr:hypothetical protein [Spirochaetales bacterium]
MSIKYLKFITLVTINIDRTKRISEKSSDGIIDDKSNSPLKLDFKPKSILESKNRTIIPIKIFNIRPLIKIDKVVDIKTDNIMNLIRSKFITKTCPGSI